MCVVAAVERVARCQMPRNAANNAMETTAARKRREKFMGNSLSPRRPRERGDPYAVSPRSGTASKTFFHHSRRGVWVPAFAGTTAENNVAPYPSRRLPDLEAGEIVVRLFRIERLAHH